MSADMDAKLVDAQLNRILVESGKLLAETSKLNAETSKLNAEATKFQRERAWYPAVVLITAVGAGAALAKLLGS